MIRELFIQSAFAVNSWTGAGNPFWNDPSNWTLGLPTLGQDLRLSVQDNSTTSVANLTMNSVYTTDNHLVNQLGGMLTANTWAVFDNGVWRGGRPLSAQDALVGPIGRGTLDWMNGTLTVGNFLSLAENDGSIADMSLSGGRVVTGELNIGYRGHATLHMEGGDLLSATPVTIGHLSGSNGLLWIQTGSLTTTQLYAGFMGGTGQVQHDGGTINAIEWVDIGEMGGSSGGYTLTGGTLTTAELVVGLQGTGTFVQTGGTASVGYLFVGEEGVATLSGGNLKIGTIELAGVLHIGEHRFEYTQDIGEAIRVECLEGDLVSNGAVYYDTATAKATILGDADGDFAVGFSDFAIISANFNTSGQWTEGDFDYDHDIDIGDFSLMSSHYGGTFPRHAVVPDISGSLFLCSLCLIRTRR